ncbi:MAG TPA: serine hydrolase [Candidatus Kapabacteria bacterium]|nr:serine hydrolase [Candidatus Kapabacteria bacterium]
MKYVLFLPLLAIIAACASTPQKRNTLTVSPAECISEFSFGYSEPEAEGINVQQLVNLTKWVQNNPQIPILSFIISKNGKVVYEMFTSSLTGDESHYLMSVTKSFTSSLVGVAIDRGYVANADQNIAELLPSDLFLNTADRSRFSLLTLKDVLGMSALNAPVPPHDPSPEAKQRFLEWWESKNRARYALTQPLLSNPGIDFLYTDITPTLAAAVVEYAAHESLFDFANENLFEPMQFANQEWMHEDPSGIDNGAYGLRLRPIDMQKFGNLFLNDGCWNGQQLISSKWIKQSFTSWIGSGENTYAPDYGSYWWKNVWGKGWTSFGAVGWKGQRIEVFPEQKMVVTMTAIINDGSENKVFSNLIHKYITHLMEPLPTGSNVALIKAKLKKELAAVRTAPSRIAPGTEPRMIPTVSNKESHSPFTQTIQ